MMNTNKPGRRGPIRAGDSLSGNGARLSRGIATLALGWVLLLAVGHLTALAQAPAGGAATTSGNGPEVVGRCAAGDGAGSSVTADPVSRGGPGVRPLGSSAAELLRGARSRSATIRELEQSIGSSDVVAYVDAELRPTVGPAAHTRWLAESAGLRYVMVIVGLDQSPQRRIELLGHELRHVVELSLSPWVHNEADVKRLYGQIGHRTPRVGVLDGFETIEARAAELRVHRDLWSAPLADVTAGPDVRPICSTASRPVCC